MAQNSVNYFKPMNLGHWNQKMRVFFEKIDNQLKCLMFKMSGSRSDH